MFRFPSRCVRTQGGHDHTIDPERAHDLGDRGFAHGFPRRPVRHGRERKATGGFWPECRGCGPAPPRGRGIPAGVAIPTHRRGTQRGVGHLGHADQRGSAGLQRDQRPRAGDLHGNRVRSSGRSMAAADLRRLAGAAGNQARLLVESGPGTADGGRAGGRDAEDLDPKLQSGGSRPGHCRGAPALHRGDSAPLRARRAAAREARC